MSQSEEQEELQIGRKLSEDIVDDETANNLKRNGTILGVIVVIVLAAVGYMYYSSSQKEKASQEASLALSKVLPEFDNGNYSVALDGGVNAMGLEVTGLVNIANKYSDVSEGKLAALYAGNAYVSTGNFTDAKTYFDKASDSEADLVQSGAYAGIALCNEEDGNFEQAAENYSNAANKLNEDILKSKYLYFAALNYEQAGNKEEAKKIFESIVDLNESSEFGSKSKVKLSMLGTKID